MIGRPKKFLKKGNLGRFSQWSTLKHIVSLNYKYEKIEKIHEGASNNSLSVCFKQFSKYEYLFILCTKNHKHVIFTSNPDNEVI